MSFRLKWVESYQIVNASKECTYCLEIVCKFGKVPRIADIVELFGEENLSFISYEECKFFTIIFRKNLVLLFYGLYFKKMIDLYFTFINTKKR